MPVPERPNIGPIQPWQFPLPEEYSLPNGLTVRLYHLPGRQLIAANLVLDLPLNAEPTGLAGLATLAIRLADEGTLTHPGATFAAALEDLGAEYGGTADEAVSTLSIVCPATRLRDALGLYAELVTQPAIADEDVARHLALAYTELEQAKMHSPALAARAFRELIYDPDSRAYLPQGPNEDSLAKIDATAIRSFHRDNWVPERATLVLAGEFPADTSQWINHAFSGWFGSNRTQYLAAKPAQPSPQILLYDRPGAVQTDLRIGSVSVDRNHPDWPALQVAGTVVGGSFGSRLNARLREELGYTYGAGAYFTPRRSTGTFSVSASVRTPVTLPTIVEILQLLEVGDQPITATENSAAINYLVGVAPVHYDTAMPIARQASVIAAMKMPVTWVNDLHASILAITPEQATETFQLHVPATNQFIALCGDASLLQPKLETLGLPVTVLDPRSVT